MYRSTAADRLHTLSTQHTKKRATLTDAPRNRTGPPSVSPLLESRGAADSLRQPRRLSYPTTFLAVSSSAINLPKRVLRLVAFRNQLFIRLLHPLICQPFDDRALSFGRVDGAVGRLRLTDCFPFHQFSSCTRICGEARIPARSKIDGNRGLSRGRSVTFDDGTRTNRADNDGIARCRPIYAPRRTED